MPACADILGLLYKKTDEEKELLFLHPFYSKDLLLSVQPAAHFLC